MTKEPANIGSSMAQQNAQLRQVIDDLLEFVDFLPAVNPAFAAARRRAHQLVGEAK